MEYLIICGVSLIAAGLTLFSGFGLGTLLLPAFALFFPAEVAVGMTAVVHLANNLFKFALLGKHADKSVAMRFGFPAIFAALIGAKMLLFIADLPAIFNWQLAGFSFSITPVNLTIGILMILFAIVEILPNLKNFSLEQKWLPFGGALSGFFGGLSGHQGALRSIFLLRAGLTKEAFIATGVVIACVIDISRIFIYSERFSGQHFEGNYLLLIAAMLTAFLGAYIGSKLLTKITMNVVQAIVSILLIVLGLALSVGII